MLSFKQYLLTEQNFIYHHPILESDNGWRPGDPQGRNPHRPGDPGGPVKLSPLSADAAIKFGELSSEYAPFLDIEHMTDQDVVDAWIKYSKGLQTPKTKLYDGIVKEPFNFNWRQDYEQGLIPFETDADKIKSVLDNTESKAKHIKDYLAQDKRALEQPEKFYAFDQGDAHDPFKPFPDATKIRDKYLYQADYSFSAMFGRPSRTGDLLYTVPDYKFALEPEHLRSIVKDSQGNAIPGPIIKPQRIEISPEAAAKVKVVRDPNRVERQVARQRAAAIDKSKNQWGRDLLQGLQQRWNEENAAAELELKFKKENPILQMQDLLKRSDAEIKALGDIGLDFDLDDWSKEYDKFETKLPIDAAKEQQGFKGKDVSTAPRGKQVLGKLTQPLPGSNSLVKSAGAYLGAGLVGALAGEYVVKPAAEKTGVFKAVESGTRAALSNSPDWVAKVADPVLGAAQVALDLEGTAANVMSKGFADKQKQDDDMMIKAGRPIGQRIIPSMKQ